MMRFVSVGCALIAVACTKNAAEGTTQAAPSASATIASSTMTSASVAPAASAVASASAAPSASAATAAPPTKQDVATFLADMSHAATAKDAAFFDAHVTFPFTIKTYVYDMEGHIKPLTFKTSAEMLKKRADWDLPAPFVKALAKSPDAKHGEQDCNQAKEADQIDYKKGAPAIQLHGTKAAVKILAEACSAEGHDESYELEADGAGSFKITKVAATE